MYEKFNTFSKIYLVFPVPPKAPSRLKGVTLQFGRDAGPNRSITCCLFWQEVH